MLRRSAIDHPLGAFGVRRPLHPDPCGDAIDLEEVVGREIDVGARLGERRQPAASPMPELAPVTRAT
jgi:hypothetical protein